MSFLVKTTEYNKAIINRIGEKLNKQIQKYKCVVGGSTVVGAVMKQKRLLRGKNWTIDKTTDIDIYVPWLVSNFDSMEIDHDFDRFIVSELGGVLIFQNDYIGIFNNSYKYYTPNRIINIIPCYNTNLKDHISSISDLDICTSCYDGYYAYVHNGIENLTATPINQHLISRFDLTRTRFSRINSSKKGYDINFHKKRTARAFKYYLRGFEIIGFNPHRIRTDIDYYGIITSTENEIDVYKEYLDNKIKKENELFLKFLTIAVFINYHKGKQRIVRFFRNQKDFSKITTQMKFFLLGIYNINRITGRAAPDLSPDDLKWIDTWLKCYNHFDLTVIPESKNTNTYSTVGNKDIHFLDDLC